MNVVQLANTYNPSKNYGVSAWYASPKLDGVRAIFIPRRGLFTRNKKALAGFDGIVDALEKICKVRGLSFVDGELIIAGKTFQATQGAILAAEHSDKEKAEFHVFAVGGDFQNTESMLKAIPHEHYFASNSVSERGYFIRRGEPSATRYIQAASQGRVFAEVRS